MGLLVGMTWNRVVNQVVYSSVLYAVCIVQGKFETKSRFVSLIVMEPT